MTIVRTETNVVVVEDDPASADVLQRRLQANGMNVSVGRTGGDGLALIRELHPDLVLLDVGLPDTDGYDVCLQVKSDSVTADIPVIFLSARGDVFDKVRGLSCGASDYLTKPFHPAELLARVDAVLSQSRRVRGPRLAKAAETTRAGRPTAIVALADPARREHGERVLAPRFEIIPVGAEGRAVDLLVVDADTNVASETGNEGPAILRIAAAGTPVTTETVALNDDLAPIADLAVRERQLGRDVDAVCAPERHAQQLREQPLIVDDEDPDRLRSRVFHLDRHAPAASPRSWPRTPVASAATTAASSSPRCTDC